MSIAPNALDIYQSGVESTKGTAVAATSKIACEELIFTPNSPLARPQIINGVLLDNAGGYETPTSRGTTWVMRGPVVFTQFQNWLGMAVGLDAAPTGTGPYVWTHTYDPTAVPSVDSRTLEWRVSDGTNNLDYEFAYCMANQLTISGGLDQLLTFELSGFARRIQDSTLTAAQSLPTADLEPHALSRVYIDSAWANLGTTLVSGQILDWSVTWRNGLRPQLTADARSDLDFTVDLVDSRAVGLEATITMLVEPNSGQYDTEKTAAEGQTLRAVRIDVQGTGNTVMQIDFLAKHEQADLFELGEQDGSKIVQARLVSATDNTNAISVGLTNDTATLT